MNSSRKKTQQYFEEYFHTVDNPSKWRNCDFPAYKVEESEIDTLLEYSQIDAKNYFFNGLLTFSEAINGIKKGNFTWSVIKLYYSVYYLLRASLYIQKIIFIRQGSIYRLEIKKGEVPFKKGGRMYNSDHQATINHYIDLYSDVDILLSNKIEDTETYNWLLDKRELVNYRIARFVEPKTYDFLSYYISKNFKKNYKDLIINEIEDEFINCFQPETAILAIPVKRLIKSFYDLHSTLPLKSVLSIQQYMIVKKTIKDEDLLFRLLSPRK